MSSGSSEAESAVLDRSSWAFRLEIQHETDCLEQSMDSIGFRVREPTRDKFLYSLSFPDRYWEPV